jgi:hypothetical protein
LHVSDIQTPALVPLAPLTLISTKFPAGTAIVPVTVQADAEDAEHDIVVSAICPGVPSRNVTLIVFDCCENTLKLVAVHPAGIHVNTEFGSVALALALFTE